VQPPLLFIRFLSQSSAIAGDDDLSEEERLSDETAHPLRRDGTKRNVLHATNVNIIIVRR